MARSWYAIKTHPRKEFYAKLNYENQQFEVFLPVTLRIARHARRVKEVKSPLFPGYLFLHLAEDERAWVAVSSTRGAVGPVRFGNCYPPVPDWFIQGLMDRADDSGLISVSTREKFGFEPGDRVIVRGPNDTMIEGILKIIDGKDRAIVLLDMLRRQVKAKVPLSSLRAA